MATGLEFLRALMGSLTPFSEGATRRGGALRKVTLMVLQEAGNSGVPALFIEKQGPAAENAIYSIDAKSTVVRASSVPSISTLTRRVVCPMADASKAVSSRAPTSEPVVTPFFPGMGTGNGSEY